MGRGRRGWRRVALATLGAAALAAAIGCKPRTPEDEYRRALGWTDADAVRGLLDAGRDPNHRFADGARPLHVVAGSLNGAAAVARVLLDAGADVNAVDGDGATAWALRWGRDDRRATEDDAAILIALLDAGFEPPTATLPGGRTLLHAAAARMPSAHLMTALVADRGFAVDARDDDGWTPLHVAAHANNAEAAKGLLQAKADANAETTRTVGEASERGKRTVWTWRYEAGSRPLDVRPQWSASRFNTDVGEVLEQHGATSNPAVDNTPR
ncbi:MAG: ankyrin repeat domain-containing protein [Nannocystaceae bacterium]